MANLFSRFLAILIGSSMAATAADPPIVAPVWPGQPPGEVCAEPETDLPARGDGTRRTTSVSRPAITVYPAPAASRPAAAILICPGGGYNYLAIDKEGSEIAAWLNSVGVTGIVLKYRVPKNKTGALQDAQRALALVRSRASEWGVDPNRLGVMGFSAGGHLAASVAAAAGEKTYAPADETDRQSSRADFAALIYPAYLLDRGGTLAFANPAAFPPVFIAVTQDDQICMPGCVALYGALSKAGVPADMHLFAKGGHAWGLRQKTLPVKMWPDLCAAWLKTLAPVDR